MSSKLVRKGLELLNKDAGLKSQKRKAAEKAKEPSKKRKGTGTVKDKQGARGVQNQGLKLSTGIKFATKLDSFIENLTNHCPHTTLILTNLLTSALRGITLPLHEEHHCVREGGRGSVVAESKVDMWCLRNFWEMTHKTKEKIADRQNNMIFED